VAAVRLRLLSELRSRWKGWLAMGALAGLFAGAVIAAVAGARRTETSYQRFLVAERAPDMMVFSPPFESDTFASISEAQLAHLPGVAAVGSAATMGVARPSAMNIVAPARPDEIMLGSSTMADVHAHVGSTISAILADSPPLVLAALLGMLAATTLAHLLVTSIRRRRRDLAVLKTLGFSSVQVRGAVASQATTLGIVAAVVGIPIGAACGRWVWIVFARQLGIVPRPAAPAVMFLVLGLAVLVVANLIAVLPGRAAARVQPALVLRSE
jgi:hypothetical protein